MSWIIGEQAAGRICELTDLFFVRKLAEARERYRLDFPHYEPWMGHPSNSYSPGVDFKPGDLFCFDRDALNRFELTMKGEPKGVFLFPEFSQRYPDGPARFQAGWDLLLQSNPWLRKVAEKLVVRILPVRGECVDWGSSVSSHLLPGLIFMGLMNPDLAFQNVESAIGFAHEVGHQALIVYQNADPILNGDRATPIYSAIRNRHRPAIMALHAAVALAFMIDTTRKLLSVSREAAENESLQSRLDPYIHGLKLSLTDMKALSPTTVGRKIIDDLATVAYA